MAESQPNGQATGSSPLPVAVGRPISEHGHSHGGVPCHGHGHSGHGHSHGQTHAAVAMPIAQVMPVMATQKQLDGEASVEDIFLVARTNKFQVLTDLIAKEPSTITLKDADGHSLLHWASLFDNTEAVAKLLEANAEVDAPAGNLQTPLMWAALRGHCPTIRLLHQAKASVDTKDSLGAFPLLLAVQHQQVFAFLLLLRLGASMFAADSNGCGILHWAAYKGDLELLRLCDYFNLDFGQVDKQGMTAMHRATSANRPLAVKFLLEHKADPELQASDGRTCLDLATKAENQQMVLMLKDPEKFIKKEATHSVDAGCTGAEKKSVLSKTLQMEKASTLLFPLGWSVCVGLSTFGYITDGRPRHLTPVANIMLEITTVLALLLMVLVIRSDPGGIPKRIPGNSCIEEIQDKLAEGVGQGLSFERVCHTCWVVRPLRAKHCSLCDMCVDEFDHHCVWVANCVGGGNRRLFMMLCFGELFAQVFHWIVHFYTLRDVHSKLGGGFFSVTTVVVATIPVVVISIVLHTLTMPWVMCLIVHQSRSIAMNVSTNEFMNMNRYKHFWEEEVVERNGTLLSRRKFHNPFDQGKVKNCLNFWLHKKKKGGGYVELAAV